MEKDSNKGTDIDLSKIGMDVGQQYETIITTISKEGKTNAAPFGVRVLDDNQVLLRIFEGGNTIKNIKDKGEFIVNICSNPIMYTLATTNTIPEEYLSLIEYDGHELAHISKTDAYFICEVETLKKGLKKDDPIRPVETNMIRCNVLELKINNPCAKAINRGIHALIESLVNYSRIKIVDDEKREYFLDRLQESERIIKKVGSKEEKESIAILKENLKKEGFDV